MNVSCYYLRPSNSSLRVASCQHPQVRVSPRTFTNEICVGCRFRAENDRVTARHDIRVLWLLADLAQGGIGTYTANLFKSLIGEGVEATAIVFYTCSPLTTDFALARTLSRFTRVICTDERSLAQEVWQSHPYIEFRPGTSVYAELFDQCDVVTTAANSPHALARTDWRGKPLLVQLHSTCDETARIAETLRPYAAHFLVTSSEAWSKATTNFSLPPDEVTLVELAVDANRITSWRSPEKLREELLQKGEHHLPDKFAVDAHWALFFGRFAPEKRIPLIAEAVKILNQRGQNWVGAFVGSGWQVQEIQGKIRKIIPERYLFVPWGGSIGDALGAADAFICASEYEGGPTTSLEALLAGIPILSTDVGILHSLTLPTAFGMPEEPVHTSLGTDPTAEQIADALETRVGNRAPMSRNAEDAQRALQAAGRFSIHRMADDWKRVLRRLVQVPHV